MISTQKDWRAANSPCLRGLLEPARSDCVHLFPALHSVMPCWWLETIHGGSTYTREISKCYKLELFWRPSCQLLPAHHCPAFRFIHPKLRSKSNPSVPCPQDDLNKTNLTMSLSDSFLFMINSLFLGVALKAFPPLAPAQLFSHFSCSYPKGCSDSSHPE